MTDSPYRAFKEKLCTFADGQAGIRNPFVIAAVDPPVEHRVAERLSTWATGTDEIPLIDDDVTIQPVWLDELLLRQRCMTSRLLWAARRTQKSSRERCKIDSLGNSFKRWLRTRLPTIDWKRNSTWFCCCISGASIRLHVHLSSSMRSPAETSDQPSVFRSRETSSAES